MELAPAYDVVPQTHQPNDGELALAVDRTHRHAAVTRTHLVTEVGSWGLRDVADLVDEALGAVHDAVARESPHPDAHPGLVDDITRFTENLLAGRAAGAREP